MQVNTFNKIFWNIIIQIERSKDYDHSLILEILKTSNAFYINNVNDNQFKAFFKKFLTQFN